MSLRVADHLGHMQRYRKPLRKGEGRRRRQACHRASEEIVEEKAQNLASMTEAEQQELLTLFRNAPGDFKNLLLGITAGCHGWPEEWVYRSAFGDEWEKKMSERKELSPLDSLIMKISIY